MKKLMTTIAACAVASLSLAAGNVTSANIVGYSRITVPATDYTQIGVPFNAVGDTNGISVQNLFVDPLGQGLKGSTGAGAADQLMFWVWTGDAYNYVNLYLYDTTSTATAALARKNKWMNPAGVPDSSWGTPSTPSSLCVKPGTAFWLKRTTGSYASPITLSVSGEVAMSTTNNRTINEGYNLIAGSFSAPFVPNPDLAGTGSAIDWLAMGAKGSTGAGAADQMMFWVWSGAAYNYVNLYLYDTTSTATAALARKNKWMNPAGVPDSSWGTASTPSLYKHPIGGAFWYKRLAGQGTFTLLETRPYNP